MKKSRERKREREREWRGRVRNTTCARTQNAIAKHKKKSHTHTHTRDSHDSHTYTDCCTAGAPLTAAAVDFCPPPVVLTIPSLKKRTNKTKHRNNMNNMHT